MSFDSLYALHYDRFSGADYASYAAFFMEAARRFADVALREALDLGCGAGGLSAVLAGAGLDMVGLDVSPEMLSVARAKPENRDVLLLCQDMREMELYGTVQGAVSAYDCLNYLGSLSELSDVLALLHNYIEPGGVFVFDVNTPARYERVYADNCFCFEDDGALLVWRNEIPPQPYGTDAVCPPRRRRLRPLRRRGGAALLFAAAHRARGRAGGLCGLRRVRRHRFFRADGGEREGVFRTETNLRQGRAHLRIGNGAVDAAVRGRTASCAEPPVTRDECGRWAARGFVRRRRMAGRAAFAAPAICRPKGTEQRRKSRIWQESYAL